MTTKQKWQPSSFKKAMEAERRESVPGESISSETENNYQFEGVIYDKYEMSSSCVSASDVTDKSFSFSALTIETFVKEGQETNVYTLTTCRYVLVKGKILMLRARDVFQDRVKAMSHIEEQNQRLEKWGESMEASNAGTAD